MDGKPVGRIRRAQNRKLEKYVKVQVHNGKNYYMLKHPKMQKSRSFGEDLERANAAALAISAHFANAADDIADILQAADTAPAHSLADIIDKFKEHYIPGCKWSANYTREIITRLDKIRKHSGIVRFTHLGVPELKEIIENNFHGDGRRQARNTLAHIYKYAIGEGLSDRTLINYAEKVVVQVDSERKRKRIEDYDAYQEIREKCPDWLQDASDFALITLQGRLEVVTATFSNNIIKKDGKERLRFQRQKTGYAVEIEIRANLKPIIQRCRIRSMKTGCPFIISSVQRYTKQQNTKEHRCQVLPDYITRKFSECTGYAFHELRSLGRRLYEQRMKEEGYTEAQIKEYIVNLTGWSNDQMYDLYGETGKVEYIKAKAGLEIN